MTEDLIKQKVREELNKRNIQVSPAEIVTNPNKGRNSLSYLLPQLSWFIKVYPSNKKAFQNVIYNHRFLQDVANAPDIITSFEICLPNGKTLNVFVIKLLDFPNLEEVPFDKQVQYPLVNLLIRIHNSEVRHKEWGDLNPEGCHFTSWNNYLYNWCNSLKGGSRIRQSVLYEIKALLSKYFEHNLGVIGFPPKSLLHGDINLGNFLMDQDLRVYSLDLDYSIIGDSAWEFASAVANWSFSDKRYHDILNVYVEKNFSDEQSRSKFRRRVNIYGPIKKASLLLAISDVSQLDLEKEFATLIQELKI